MKWQLIKRWLKMLVGRSNLHTKQIKGRYYKKHKIRGYYSDLRHKVLNANFIDELGIPYNKISNGEIIYFPIGIFQYGLGAYDLYLETRDEIYKKKFFTIVEWALKNQLSCGEWKTFEWVNIDAPYSSMAQAEGASLLCRAYVETRNILYMEKAKKAINFMLKSTLEGGTSRYNGEDITFEEVSTISTVLNGMIFSIWGLYDLYILTENKEIASYLDKSIKTLERILYKYDRGYWSNYDLEGNIASPFYHNLHIEQLKVMYDLFGNFIFKDTYLRWESYQHSICKSKLAFIVKVLEKLKNINKEKVLIG